MRLCEMEMLSCDLKRTGGTPLYEQLYEYIKNEIIQGRLPFKTKLPSKRKLADFLQISQNTIDTAYNQLVAEGYLEVIPRKGYFVMASEDLEYIPKIDRTEKQQEQERVYRFHFHPSQIDTTSFPFASWRKLAKQVIDVGNNNLLLLGNSKGEYELRKEIANYLYHARGVICTPQQIILGAGVEILLQQLIGLFKEDTIYGVEDPGYHLIHRILKQYPKQVFPLSVNEEGLAIDELEQSKINVLYMTPSHHFPYGNVLSVNQRVKLLNWAVGSENRYIIEDDYDSEFRYIGKSIPSLQSMDQFNKVIYLGSFSKSLMPSIRISYMVLPNQLLKIYEEEFSFYHSTVSRIDQHILAKFIRQGMFEKHLNRMRKVYRQKRDIVISTIRACTDQISIIGGNSGLHIVLVVDNGMTEVELVKQAEMSNLKIYPLSSYRIVEKESTLPEIVCGFAGIETKKLEEAIRSLLESWGL